LKRLRRRVDRWDADVARQIAHARAMASKSPEPPEVLAAISATLTGMQRAMQLQKARLERDITVATGMRDFIARPPAVPTEEDIMGQLIKTTALEFNRAARKFDEAAREFSSPEK
jgi:hypothetical protein